MNIEISDQYNAVKALGRLLLKLDVIKITDLAHEGDREFKLCDFCHEPGYYCECARYDSGIYDDMAYK